MTSQQGQVDFSGVRWGSVEWTNLCTLYLRACESRSPRPILGDRTAAEAVDRIDYDFKRMHRAVNPAANRFLVALRAKQFDMWTTDFLRRHPNAVVLHLGCGLDSRVMRLSPSAGARWFDVDQPGVIDLRRKLYADHDGYQMIGSSVTEDGWLDRIPTDGPALVVAEGLLMYLTEAEVAGAAAEADGPIRHRRVAVRHAVAVEPAAVKAFHIGNREVGHRRRPRNRVVEPAAALPRGRVGDDGEREDSVDAAAGAVPAAVCDPGDPGLRPANPLRVLLRASRQLAGRHTERFGVAYRLVANQATQQRGAELDGDLRGGAPAAGP